MGPKIAQDQFYGMDQRAAGIPHGESDEARSQLFRQASVLLPQGQAIVQGQMVPGTEQLSRYPIDKIVETMSYML